MQDEMTVVTLAYSPEYYGDTVEVKRVVENPGHLENMIHYQEQYGHDVQVTRLDYVPGNTETVECIECDAVLIKVDTFRADLYSTPFDSAPADNYFCNDHCYDGFYGRNYSKDFQYFYCEDCGRDICEQNPANGWHVQVRYINGEPICLRCYEESIIANGIDRESFENHTIDGMFFNSGDMENAGYIEQGPSFIRSQDSINEYCETALGLIDSGHKVITEYDSLGLGGSEGTVTLWIKKTA